MQTHNRNRGWRLHAQAKHQKKYRNPVPPGFKPPKKWSQLYGRSQKAHRAAQLKMAYPTFSDQQRLRTAAQEYLYERLIYLQQKPMA